VIHAPVSRTRRRSCVSGQDRAVVARDADLDAGDDATGLTRTQFDVRGVPAGGIETAAKGLVSVIPQP